MQLLFLPRFIDVLSESPRLRGVCPMTTGAFHRPFYFAWWLICVLSTEARTCPQNISKDHRGEILPADLELCFISFCTSISKTISSNSPPVLYVDHKNMYVTYYTTCSLSVVPLCSNYFFSYSRG